MSLQHGARDRFGFDFCQSTVFSATAVELTQSIVRAVEHDIAEFV